MDGAGGRLGYFFKRDLDSRSGEHRLINANPNSAARETANSRDPANAGLQRIIKRQRQLQSCWIMQNVWELIPMRSRSFWIWHARASWRPCRKDGRRASTRPAVPGTITRRPPAPLPGSIPWTRFIVGSWSRPGLETSGKRASVRELCETGVNVPLLSVSHRFLHPFLARDSLACSLFCSFSCLRFSSFRSSYALRDRHT